MKIRICGYLEKRIESIKYIGKEVVCKGKCEVYIKTTRQKIAVCSFGP